MKFNQSTKKTGAVPDSQACRHLFLVQDRTYWHSCPFPYDKNRDVVLTYDFGVWHEIAELGGRVALLDHLVDMNVMEQYNYATYDFFAKWHYDQDGNDIFAYSGVKVGNAFRIAIWSNITQYARTFINLLAVKKMVWEKMFVGISDSYAMDILHVLDLKNENWEPRTDRTVQEYYFPILRWIDENIYPSGLKQTSKIILTKIRDLILSLYDRLKIFGKKDANIFINPYYPTERIIAALKNKANINLILENYTWTRGFFQERRLPVSGSLDYRQLALAMIEKFPARKAAKWSIEGFPISEYLYPIILQRIAEPLADCLRTLDSIIEYFQRRKLNLMVTFSNIGFTNCLMINYCHHHQIPTYLIINGLLATSFVDEAKDATWINSYGESVKKHYFRGMDNIVCLGDPRMDNYIKNYTPHNINTEKPLIVIAASGFTNIDLNSYVAVEFDFLYGIMRACQILRATGRDMRLTLKIRPNGYRRQYENFLQEYFPEIAVRIYDRFPIKDVLDDADLLISTYSQTLFEASCMNIPVLYYKNDTQVAHPPFDNASELVTAVSLDDLVEKLNMFYNSDPLYDAFRKREVMEKYIGPLDGHNLERNMEFIYSLIDEPDELGAAING